MPLTCAQPLGTLKPRGLHPKREGWGMRAGLLYWPSLPDTRTPECLQQGSEVI